MNRSSSVPPKTKMTIGLVDKLFKKLPYSYQRDIPIVKEAVRGKSKNFYEYLSKNNVPKYIEVDKTPEELYKEFIKDFVSFRKENNLTQELLSLYSKVNRVKIARIESDMHSPTIKAMIDILGPLGYTLKIEKVNKKKKKENKDC